MCALVPHHISFSISKAPISLFNGTQFPLNCDSDSLFIGSHFCEAQWLFDWLEISVLDSIREETHESLQSRQLKLLNYTILPSVGGAQRTTKSLEMRRSIEFSKQNQLSARSTTVALSSAIIVLLRTRSSVAVYGSWGSCARKRRGSFEFTAQFTTQRTIH